MYERIEQVKLIFLASCSHAGWKSNGDISVLFNYNTFVLNKTMRMASSHKNTEKNSGHNPPIQIFVRHSIELNKIRPENAARNNKRKMKTHLKISREIIIIIQFLLSIFLRHNFYSYFKDFTWFGMCHAHTRKSRDQLISNVCSTFSDYLSRLV